MSIATVIADAEKDINIAEVWVTKISSFVKTLVTREKALAPEVAGAFLTLAADCEEFLAAATPAVAGEGLNFPADSVAYAAFVKLVGDFQAIAAVVKDAAKAA